MTTREGDWMTTFTGRQFWPIDPRPEDICLEDIAHSLARQCRFAGHTRHFYSVAQHSVMVSRLVDRYLPESATAQSPKFKRALELAGLLHDATEAYLVDVPRPVKHMLLGYKEIEQRLHSVIFEWAGLPEWTEALPDIVKIVDRRLLLTEIRLFMPKFPDQSVDGDIADGFDIHFDPLLPAAAEGEFMSRAKDLFTGRTTVVGSL
jgi:5'-deoxynucleotidase YfbR-like HD superfamily hydrolase